METNCFQQQQDVGFSNLTPRQMENLRGICHLVRGQFDPTPNGESHHLNILNHNISKYGTHSSMIILEICICGERIPPIPPSL